jgi:hypothetical protein
MTTASLPAAPRTAAEGLCTLKAATGLLVTHDTWLGWEGSHTRFIRHGAGTAAIDGETAVNASDGCGLPGSGRELRMLRLVAGLAD